MDVIIYTRVSTDDQKVNGFSLQDQERRLRQHCKQFGKNILKHFQDDHSAKDFNRPAFQQLLSELRNKKLRPKQLIAVRWDRFSRNLTESLSMKTLLREYGVEIFFLENNYDETIPENLIPLIIQMALPQVENERRGLNTKQGMRQALRQGKWVWKAPKGYINDKVNKIVKVGAEAHFIVRAFNEVSYGIKSVDSIRKVLNREGFKCSKQNLLNILRNPFYMGKLVIEAWKNEPKEIVNGIHEAIIDEDIFEKVQMILSSRNKKQPKKSRIKELFPLRGHLICKQCGCNLTASSSQGRSKKYHYYHCQNGCKERLDANTVNNTFESYLDSFIVNDEIASLYSEILRDVYYQNESSKESQIRDIDNRISVLQEKLKSLDNKLLNDNIADDDYKRITTNIKAEISRMEKEKHDLSIVETNLEKHFSYGITFLSHMNYYYNNAPIEIKHKIIGSIFPDKLIFEGNNYRTERENSLISLICSDTMKYNGVGKKKATQMNGLSTFAPPSVLFSNQFKEDLSKLFELNQFIDVSVKTLPINNPDIYRSYHPSLVLNQ